MEKWNGLASILRLDRASGRTLLDLDFSGGDFSDLAFLIIFSAPLGNLLHFPRSWAPR